MSAREPAPASRGNKIVFTRERSKGPGESATAELPVSSSQHSTKGIVKMPARLVPTVSSSASAALPPTACAAQKVSHYSFCKPVLAELGSQQQLHMQRLLYGAIA